MNSGFPHRVTNYLALFKLELFLPYSVHCIYSYTAVNTFILQLPHCNLHFYLLWIIYFPLQSFQDIILSNLIILITNQHIGILTLELRLC